MLGTVLDVTQRYVAIVSATSEAFFPVLDLDFINLPFHTACSLQLALLSGCGTTFLDFLRGLLARASSMEPPPFDAASISPP